MRPLARRDDLVVRELPGELVVYDRREHRAHCLNDTAARVFRAADGTRGVAELAEALDAGVESGVRESLVRAALDQLGAAGLLASAPDEGTGSRRELLRRLGGAAALLAPAVASVLAPTPADAASCVDSCLGQTPGTPCACIDPPPPPCGTCSVSGICEAPGAAGSGLSCQ